jgi:hypothetical protein
MASAADTSMEPDSQTAPSPTITTLPSARRLLLFAVLLPAVIVVTNHLLIETLSYDAAKIWCLPSLVASTAALSWCAGRYLHPAWFRMILFVWCLVLLDTLITLAGLTGRIDDQFGYVLVSAQISLLVLWAVLGARRWQWRLPVIAALAPLVIVFSGSFMTAYSRYESRTWNAMMFISAAIVALLCGGLRYFGFTLQDLSGGKGDGTPGKSPTYQFGMKHLLIWFTVSGPLLLLIRGLDLKGTTVFPAALLSVSIATVNLLAIWAVLTSDEDRSPRFGSGYWIIRFAILIGIPFAIALGMTKYSAYLGSMVTPRMWQAGYYGSVNWIIAEMHDHWIAWLWLDAALLAALLLFFRASGYRLTRAAK